MMTLGKYFIRVALRQDNPAFAKYLIFLNGKLLGTQFSMPGITDCQWHERERKQMEAPPPFELQDRNAVRRRRGNEKSRSATVKTSPFSRFAKVPA